jgi:hypothetical protein
MSSCSRTIWSDRGSGPVLSGEASVADMWSDTKGLKRTDRKLFGS